MFKLKKQPTVDWMKIRTAPSKRFFSKIAKILGFDYVVKRIPPSKLCFGSTLSRKILPITEIKSMSPLIIRFQPKPTINNVLSLSAAAANRKSTSPTTNASTGTITGISPKYSVRF